jgi:hypothetical protein
MQKPKAPSPVEQKIALVKEQFADVDEAKARKVLRALPDAAPSEVAMLAQDDELFNQVGKGNLSARERGHLYRKHRDAQGNLLGMGEGGLFDVQPEPVVESAPKVTSAPPPVPKLPHGIAPKAAPEPVPEPESDTATKQEVTAAGKAHSEMLPSGQRRGFAIGDGTGVGKGEVFTYPFLIFLSSWDGNFWEGTPVLATSQEGVLPQKIGRILSSEILRPGPVTRGADNWSA